MTRPLAHLQIRVHEVTGAATAFVQSDPDVIKQIVESFQPLLIFKQDWLVVGDSNSQTTFPVTKVTRVELNSESDCQLIFPSDLISAYELTSSQFHSLIRNPVMSEQWHNLNPEDKSVVVFLELITADDKSVLLTMDMNIDAPPRFIEMRQHLLNRPALCFRMQNGGVALINLANITRLTFFPGSLDMPANAWPARFSRPETTLADVPPPGTPKRPQITHLQAK
jgi:hypothetical protein